jgi:hypothetical protein
MHVVPAVAACGIPPGCLGGCPTRPALPCPSFPPCRPGEGYFNLIYTPPSSRRRGLQVMTASERGEHMALVKQRRVAALALEPQSTGGWWVSCGSVGAALGAPMAASGQSPYGKRHTPR